MLDETLDRLTKRVVQEALDGVVFGFPTLVPLDPETLLPFEVKHLLHDVSEVPVSQGVPDVAVFDVDDL